MAHQHARGAQDARPDLAGLIAYNSSRAHAFRNSSLFDLVSGGLEDPRKRNVFLSCLHRFSTNFQTIMLTRQAMCADPKYMGVFREHLSEEIDHDKLLTQREGAREMYDPILEALTVWFSYQMVLIDNADKTALMHLVLETAGDLFYSVAAQVLGKHVPTGYFEAHAELDEGHAELGAKLLTELSDEDYRRLIVVVERGWDMIDAVAARTITLVAQVDDS